MPSLKKCFNIKQNDFIHAGEISINIQKMLKSLNMDRHIVRRIAVCGYEGEMNVVMHGGNGLYCVEIFQDKIIIDITDDGPGIENIEKAMQEGFSTAKEEHREMGFGAGMGLPNMKKNSDDIQVTSEINKGTQVQMTFYM